MSFSSICKLCGKEREHKHLYRVTKYCSKKCARLSRRTNGAWAIDNQDVLAKREYHRNYYKNNRTKINAANNEWAKNNRIKRNYLQQKRRSSGELSFEEWHKIIESAGRCSNCGTTERLEVDHIIAITKGGKTEKENLQVLCRSCNASKGNGDMPKRHLMMSVHDIEILET